MVGFIPLTDSQTDLVVSQNAGDNRVDRPTFGKKPQIICCCTWPCALNEVRLELTTSPARGLYQLRYS